MNEYQVYPLFSSPVFLTHLTIDCNYILDVVSNLNYESYQEGGGFGSVSKKVLENPKLFGLKNQIDNSISTYLYDVLKFEKSNSIKFVLETSWVNLHHKGDYAVKHIHKNSIYSFVFYVDVDGVDSGSIHFTSPLASSTYCSNAFDLPISSYNIYNSKDWGVCPVNGLLLIFPSTLEHFVEPNLSDKFRYSISGNYFVRGSVKIPTCEINF